jgi:hypothetical protein
MIGQRKTASCDECGKEVTKLLSQTKEGAGWYCSRQCSGKGKYKKALAKRWAEKTEIPKTPRACCVCGKEVFRRGTLFVTSAEITCSRSCKAKRQTNAAIAEGTWKQPVKKRRGETTACEVCTKPVYASVSERALGQGRFCSRKCANEYQARNQVQVKCAYCDKPFKVSPSQAGYGRKYCSRACDANDKKYTAIDRMHNGRNVRINSSYLFIWEPTHAKNFRGWVSEHRWLVEQQVGRPLETTEHVHHINGNKQDNRLENLRLMSREDHMQLTHRELSAKRKTMREQLAEYEKRFGPLT